MRIPREQHVHTMSAAHPPIARVRPGQRLTLETMDALDGQVITLAGELAPTADGPFRNESANPATGPLFIEGVAPGDGVVVEIHDVRPVGVGFIGAHAGALGGRVSSTRRRTLRPEHGRLRFNEQIAIDVEPMIGVIGLAPAEGEVPNQSPGDHGGNLDTALIKAGSRVVLSAAHPGGLLAVGDIHTVMADGEINGQGVETFAEVDLTVHRLPGWGMRRPLVETPDLWAAVASHSDLERACRTACADMLELLTAFGGLDSADAFILLGLAGQVRVCQLVNPLRTARVEIAKRYLPPEFTARLGLSARMGPAP